MSTSLTALPSPGTDRPQTAQTLAVVLAALVVAWRRRDRGLGT